MANIEKILVPDIGDFDSVDVVEVLVGTGDTVAVDDSLISLESDKATMDVPSPKAGVVQDVKIKAGDQVAEGDLILTLEVVEEVFAAYEVMPFGLCLEEFTEFAVDQFRRRLVRVEKARGQTLEEVVHQAD